MNFFNYEFSNTTFADLSDNAKWLLEQRYFNGQEHSFEQLVRRVSRVVASTEVLYSDSIDWLRTLEKNIANDMLSRRFLFNSPCLFSAGAGLDFDYKDTDLMTLEDYQRLYNSRTKNQQLFACFVISIPDSIEGIFESVKNAGIISKFGGGVGGNFGHLRERSSGIEGGSFGHASGPVSFMDTWNTMGAVVVQGGKRRAALMGMLFDDHPDIDEFIDCKTKDNKLSYFNISVAISDKLMNAAKNDGDFELHSRVDNSVVKTVKAKDLMNHICESAWQRGDPGVFFIDRARQDNILKMGGDKWEIESTNPCGEQPLPNFTSCNLGSINVETFIDENGRFNFSEFERQVKRSMYYLDLVIDACSYPLEKIEKRTKSIRPVDLGIMGLADASIKQNIIYGSDEFVIFCNQLADSLARSALTATIEMVTEAKKTPFDESHLVQELFSGYKVPETPEDFTKMLKNMRNEGQIPNTLINTLECFNFEQAKTILKNLFKGNMCNSRRLSIAPTGSISMILDASSGIEPVFAWSWNRRVTKNDGSGYEVRDYWHRLITPEQREEYKKDGKISNPVFVTAHDISTDQHVNVMGVFARIIDSAISKTVNLPNSATVEDVRRVYQDCYNIGCKGITIYRDGSRSFQPIEVKKKETEKRVKERPSSIIFGKTIKDTTPWGSIYLTLNFDGEKPFEIFINIGKSGSELKAMTEALSRVISIGLRSGCNLEDFIDTLKGLSGKEYWMLNSDDDHITRSIPDAIALLLEKLIDRQGTDNDKKLTCPECGSPMEKISGCEYCFSCGYSPCK
ncbi:MAG: adenosylcobalamin-dependent ribonucleoside-diphosphate reductase [Synergistaceae bacterium]|nr:adenosylcobalamin-dependent ribonucleoside-diphosphate reductase [Synergistaceae bacterium]